MIKYIILCLKYWWVILLVTVISGGAAAYLSFYYLPPVYSATTTMYVFKLNESEAQTNETVYHKLLASEMLVQDYKEMVKTNININQTIQEIQDEYPLVKEKTIKQISDSIRVSVKPTTRLIDVNVEFIDPYIASAIANKLSEIFRTQTFELLNAESITIINYATVPSSPISPKPLQNTALSIFAGIMSSIALIVFVDYLRVQFAKESQETNPMELLQDQKSGNELQIRKDLRATNDPQITTES